MTQDSAEERGIRGPDDENLTNAARDASFARDGGLQLVIGRPAGVVDGPESIQVFIELSGGYLPLNADTPSKLINIHRKRAGVKTTIVTGASLVYAAPGYFTYPYTWPSSAWQLGDVALIEIQVTCNYKSRAGSPAIVRQAEAVSHLIIGEEFSSRSMIDWVNGERLDNILDSISDTRHKKVVLCSPLCNTVTLDNTTAPLVFPTTTRIVTPLSTWPSFVGWAIEYGRVNMRIRRISDSSGASNFLVAQDLKMRDVAIPGVNWSCLKALAGNLLTPANGDSDGVVIKSPWDYYMDTQLAFNKQYEFVFTNAPAQGTSLTLRDVQMELELFLKKA